VVRLGMGCCRLTYSPRSMLGQNCHKKTAQKVGSCVGRAYRCVRFLGLSENAVMSPLYSTPRTFTMTRFGRCPSNSA
jgi:hypothetical protein